MDFFNTLKQIKDKIANITQDIYEGNFKKYIPEDPKVRDERINLKLDSLLELQNPNEHIKINAGGKLYILSKTTLFNCQYTNIFQESLQKNPNQLEIFIDCSKSLFKFIIFIIRRLNKTEYMNYSNDQKLKINLDERYDEELLEILIKEIFRIDYGLILSIIQMREKKLDNIQPEQVINNTPPINDGYDNDYDRPRANRNNYEEY